MMKKILNESILNLLLSLATLLLLVAAFLPLVNISPEWLSIIYVTGAVLAVLVRLMQRFNYRKDKTISTGVRRLLHVEFWSSMCYLVSAYFMIADKYHPGNWLAFLLAGAALQIYTSFMTPYRQKKEAMKK